jgi:hypothetical protein
MICTNTSIARIGVPIFCTISVSDAYGATTGLSSDFTFSSTVASSPLILSDGGSTFTFSTTPVAITTSFYVRVKASANKAFVLGGSTAFTVYGTPTTATSLTCTGTAPSRQGVPVVCTISVSGLNGATTGVASDFAVFATDPFTSLSSKNGGFSFTFTTTPTSTTTQFSVTVQIMSSNATVTNGTTIFVVYGNPTISSTLLCTNTNPSRIGLAVGCTISVSGANGATTGIVSDFSVSSTVTATGLSTSNGGSTFTFSTIPAYISEAFKLTVSTIDGIIEEGDFSFTVYGTPNSASILNCAVPTPARKGQNVMCTITVANEAGWTTGLASDFTVTTTIPSTQDITLESSDAGKIFTFSTELSNVSSSFQIKVDTNHSTIQNGVSTFVVYGNPSTSSKLACNNTSAARSGIAVVCTINVFDDIGATTGLAGDFVVSSSSPFSPLEPLSEGATFVFSIVPTTTTSAFDISVSTIIDNGVIASGATTFTVYGHPSSSSTQSCTYTTPARAHQPITCTISVSDVNGATTGLPSDFGAYSSNEAGISLISEDGGLTYVFTTTPTSDAAPYRIDTRINDDLIVDGSVSIIVYGNPTNHSVLSCIAPSPVRTDSDIQCLITVMDANGHTTGLPDDFKIIKRSEFTGEDVLTPVTEDGGSTFHFSFRPDYISTNLTVNVSVYQQIVQSGLPSFVVHGHPDATSQIFCTSSQARASGDPIQCTIDVAEKSAPTTGVPEDFTTIVNGIPTNVTLVQVRDKYGSQYVFNVTAPGAFDDKFNVSISFSNYSNGGNTVSNVFRVLAPSTGPPSNASTVTCSYTTPRVGDTIQCSVTFLSSSGQPTSVSASDLHVTAGDDLSSVSLRRRNVVSNFNTTNGGLSYSFLVPLSSIPAPAFVVAAYVNGALIASLTFQLFGTPSVASSLECSAETSPAGFVHVLETVYCVIYPWSSAANTTAIATDFKVFINDAESPVHLTRMDGGLAYSFIVTSPNSSWPNFVLHGALANGDVFEPPGVNLTLICLFSTNFILSFEEKCYYSLLCLVKIC